MADKQVEFIGKIVRQTYDSENYKMYACDINREKYPELKHTKYGNVCIGGNLHSLVPETEYFIRATERSSPKGYSYQVLNIKKTELKTKQDVYLFLREILTEKQAAELYREYPNIVDLVVNNQSNQVDLNKLHGIGEYTFNIIKNKIIENYALFDVINEFKGVLTMSMLKKLYDKYPSIEKIRSEMRVKPYTCLCSLSRVGFKTADALLLELEDEGIIKFEFDLKTSKERCNACIMYFLDQNELEGNTKMKIVDLRKQVMKLVPACAHHFVDCLNGNSNIYYTKETMEIALKNTYETERYIANILLDTIKNKNKVWYIDWKSYKDKGEYPLSDEQLNALGLVCNKQVTILCGFAGSGKTATTNTLIKMLMDNNKTFTLMASTGRAAKVLQSYTGMPASTIHRAYGYIPPNEWGYNYENKIETDIVIVDETSMCDVFLFYHLLDGIDFDKTKLFIIGDPAQLCSVGPGNLLNDLINSEKIPVASLTKIFRYNEGGLMQVATDTRNGKQLNLLHSNKYVSLGENKDFNFLQSTNENIIKNISNLYKGLLDKGISPNDIMILSAQNKGQYGTVVINNELQKIANKNYDSKNYMKIGDSVFYEGDLVIQTKNNYHAELYLDEEVLFDDESVETMVANGETMTILEITPLYVILDLNGIKIKYFRSDMEEVSLAYSISTHRSQGGSAKIVIFIAPTSHTFMLSSNLLYVGFTRTKEKCFTIGDLATINRAIKKKEEVRRNTFLLDLLK